MSNFLQTAVLAAAVLAAPMAVTPASAAAHNIVLVHGMGNDGSVWRPVHDILKAKGYRVSIVQQPLNGFAEDVKATERTIEEQDGPVVLVGHSYGGVVITTAGNDPKVKALVYVAALQPDAGETMGSLNTKIPAAFDAKGMKTSADGYVTVAYDTYLRDVVQDLPPATADFLAASQAPTTSAVFTAATIDPAWRHKPAYGIIAVHDRTVSPDLQRWMYKRSGTKVTEVRSGHMVPLSQPHAVAVAIIKAAEAAE